MPRTDPKDEVQRFYACLDLVRGKQINEIAQAHGRDRSTITRWLIRAEKDGWIDRRPRLTLPPQRLLQLAQHARDRAKEQRLLELLRTPGSPLREVRVAHIIPPLESGPALDDEGLAERLREVTGRIAAHYVNELIQGYGGRVTVGLSWGRSLAKTVDAIEMLSPPRVPDLECLPLIGSLEVVPARQREELARAEANTLAIRLCAAYGARPPNLLSTPAYLPHDARDPTLSVLRSYFETTPSYRDIFGGPDSPGRIWQTDIAVIGVGAIETAAWPVLTRYISPDDFGQLKAAGAVGDIAAQFFTEDGLHPTDCRCLLCVVNTRVLGVRLRTLAALADGRGGDGKPFPAERPRPHVIAVTSGRAKVRAIAAAARIALTGLVVDEDTAEELIRLLQGQTRAARTAPGDTDAGRQSRDPSRVEKQ